VFFSVTVFSSALFRCRFLLRYQLPIHSTSDATELRKAIVAGFFPHAAQMMPDGTYRTVKDQQVCSV